MTLIPGITFVAYWFVDTSEDEDFEMVLHETSTSSSFSLLIIAIVVENCEGFIMEVRKVEHVLDGPTTC